MTEMTRAEFYAKYGDVEVTFSSYEKYLFRHEAALPNGKKLVVGCGGTDPMIYRHKVAANRAETVNQLLPYTGCVYEGNDEVEWFYDPYA